MKQNSQFETADADELTGAEITFKMEISSLPLTQQNQPAKQQSSLIRLET